MDKVIKILTERFKHFPFTGNPLDYYEEIKSCDTCQHEDNPFCLGCNRLDYPDWEPKRPGLWSKIKNRDGQRFRQSGFYFTRDDTVTSFAHTMQARFGGFNFYKGG